MKQIVSLLAALCLTFSLAACGNSVNQPQSADETGGDNAHNVDMTENISDNGEWIYKAETLPLPDGMVFVTAQYELGNRIYVGGVGETAVLGYSDIEGGTGLIDLPEDCEFVYSMCVNGGDLVVLAGTYPFLYTDAAGELVINESLEGRLELLSYGADGELKSRTQLSERYTEPRMIFKIMLCVDGEYIVLSHVGLVKLGADGSELGRISSDDEGDFSSMCLFDGDIVVSRDNGKGRANSMLCILDTDAFVLTTPLELEDLRVRGLGVSSDGRLLINNAMSGDESVCYLDMVTGETEEIITWIDVGIAGYEFKTITQYGDRLVFYDSYEKAINTARYVYISAVRTELIVAADVGSNIYSIASRFNSQSEEYKITVVTYGIEEKSMDMLRAEIIAGKAPDVYAMSFGSLKDVEKSGVFEDLFPYLDADTEYGRDTLISSIISVMSSTGKLYWLPRGFSIMTFIAPESVVGEPGMSMAKLKSLMAQQPEDVQAFPSWMTKGTLLSWVISFSTDRYIDEANGTCSFDNPDFIGMLEECNTLEPDNFVGDAYVGYLRDNDSLLKLMSLQSLELLGGLSQRYNGDYCFVGFPNEGTNGSLFSFDIRLAVSSTSEHKDAAWSFVRSVLSVENQQDLSGFMPVVRSELEAMAADALENGTESDSYTVSQSDLEKFWDLINNTRLIYGNDSTLQSIIQEEAEVYFSGDCSAEKAAMNIQSRASMYLSERH